MRETLYHFYRVRKNEWSGKDNLNNDDREIQHLAKMFTTVLEIMSLKVPVVKVFLLLLSVFTK